MKYQWQDSHPLLSGINKVEEAICCLKENVKRFYFAALLSRYHCPSCGERFNLTGPSQAGCVCGLAFDPTIEFQKCQYCGNSLLKKVFHYACSSCGRINPSQFLFDEKVFDPEYFRESMRLSREKERQQNAELREMLRISRSDSFPLMEEIDLNNLPGLEDDLNQLSGICKIPEDQFEIGNALSFEDYRRHIINLLDSEMMFNSIAPLNPEERRDKVYRFATLIIMEHDRDINLYQMGNDILVSKA
jgi:predicted RNA-binding Zn-ribbon protein involved in translation (DUF1610 family)